MNEMFKHRLGAVFAPEGVSGTNTASQPLASTNDSMSQYEGMFQQNMADQMKLYAKTNELNQQKNTMQSIMDVGMKAGKAVQS